MCIRVPAPTPTQIMDALAGVCQKEGLGQLPPQLGAKIVGLSGRNLRKALLQLEVCRVQALPQALNDTQPVMATDWELYIQEIAADILGEQSPKRLYLVRGKLYELLANCIPPELIIKTLLLELLKRLDQELKHGTVHWAAFYEHRLQEGQKAIFHLEAFVAKFMSLYKTWTISMME